MGPKVFTNASVGSKTNTKALMLSAFYASIFSAIIDESSIGLEVHSFITTRFFYLPRFDLMIGTLMNVVLRNKTRSSWGGVVLSKLCGATPGDECFYY